MTVRTALFISPHLDDVAFSCGGLAALLADAGWRTIMATVFTRSVVPATGFALACQLDKGLAADIDYMALRREEDLRAAEALGVAGLHWMDFPEAPHRGYHSAPALFGNVGDADIIVHDIAAALAALDEASPAALILAPQGLGAHVDHRIVLQAALRVFDAGRLAFYRDTPYAIRNSAAPPLAGVPAGPPTSIPIMAALDRKIAASCAYASQIGFQFGGAAALSESLRAFAHQEGNGVPAERFLGAGFTVA